MGGGGAVRPGGGPCLRCSNLARVPLHVRALIKRRIRSPILHPACHQYPLFDLIGPQIPERESVVERVTNHVDNHVDTRREANRANSSRTVDARLIR